MLLNGFVPIERTRPVTASARATCGGGYRRVNQRGNFRLFQIARLGSDWFKV